MALSAPVLWGPKFHVNTATLGSQVNSAITALPDGTFVATWSDPGSESGADPSKAFIRMQLFHADGQKKGGEVSVSSSLAGGQMLSSATALKDGRFVVTWTDSLGADGAGYGIAARIFNADGSPFGSDFMVTQGLPGGQLRPSIAALSDGGFAISYASDTGDGSGTCVLSQAYDGAGQKVGDKLLVNATTTAGIQSYPVTIGLDNRYGVFFWDMGLTPSDLSDDTVRGRILSSSGEAGPEFVVAKYAGYKINASATTLKDGRFLVTWANDTGDGSGANIKGQIYNADGSQVGEQFLLNSNLDGDQSYSSVTALADGGFALAYTSSAGSSNNIYVTTFDADGNRSTGYTLFDSSASYFHEGVKPSLTALADGRLVVCWGTSTTQPDDPAGGVYARIIDPRNKAVTLTGTNGNDEYVGTGFDDRINGGAGADTMNGGLGNDTYYVDNAGDRIMDDAGVDTVISTTSYALASYLENLVASGSGPINLTGNSLGNTITGNAGANKINGGYGNDVLSGGAGRDTFVFNAGLGTAKTDRSVNFDTITDFSVKDDGIHLDNAIFKKLGRKGSEAAPAKLNKAFFKIGPKAADKDDYLIYNKKTGVLSYDADGSGAKAAIEFAQLKKNLSLTYKDFFIV